MFTVLPKQIGNKNKKFIETWLFCITIKKKKNLLWKLTSGLKDILQQQINVFDFTFNYGTKIKGRPYKYLCILLHIGKTDGCQF